MLTAPFTEMEIKDVVFSMHPNKALGLDGMNLAFFQHYWHILGQDVCTACLSFISNCAIPEEINATHTVLISKKKQIEDMGDLRPISLYVVIYKITANAITNRLKRVLPAVIAYNQSTFIPSRAIPDNLLISYEILHYLNRKTQGKQGYAVLKVNIAKAYHRVEWGFLEKIMLKIRFHDNWVRLIMKCIMTVRFHILYEGKEIGHIHPQRGLRQGDPLNFSIFISYLC